MSAAKPRGWFTRRGGQIRGPYAGEQISRYILLGRILEDDELSPDCRAWQPVSSCPELIPDVMKDVRTEAGRQRLAAARRKADERSGRDRRTRRMSPSRIERRGRDRRRTAVEASAASLRPRRGLLPAAAGILVAGVLLYLSGLY